MKISILTFQFAHNYGALLQAYSLKKYIESLGHEVELAPYYPDWAQKEYAISPFAKGISIRKRLRFAFQYTKRKKLAQVFQKFQKDKLELNRSLGTTKELEDYLNHFDCIIFGSDQIWNDNITGDTTAYYGGNISNTRISYAASLGKKVLSPAQKQKIASFLPKFKAVSVRESTSEKLLEELVDIPIKTVIDPVFLHSATEWEKICKPVDVDGKFMFLYFLHNDLKLFDYARQYANEHGLTICEVHPTLARFHSKCKPLMNVGPQEFLWLIRNAQCICTNSFHATSFSVIFRKKLLHIPNPVSPERTASLLSLLGIDINNAAESLPLYDFGEYEYSNLNGTICNSKHFLQDVLKAER